MRHLSQLGKAERSRGERFIVTRTLDCKHWFVSLIFENWRTERTRTVIVFVDSEVHKPFCHGPVTGGRASRSP